MIPIVAILLGTGLSIQAPAASQAPAPATGAAQPTPNLEAGPPPNRVMIADPVMLRRGQVITGDRGRYADFEGNRYLFSGNDTLRTFREDPARWAARDGGACGRMGPLGGLGDARLYALEGELLYFFASEACMQRFKSNPRRYMEAYDIMPVGTPEQQVAGLAAIDRWIGRSGGREAVEAAERYSQRSTRRVQVGDARWEVEEVIEIDGPRTMRSTKRWRKAGDAASDPVETRIETTPSSAVIGGSNGVLEPLVPTRRESFERSLNRLPYSILRARFRPEAGFLAVKTGEGRLGEHDCDFVQTWFEGNRTALAIDRSSGRLVQLGYTGRLETAEAAVVSLYRDVLADGGPEVLRLPTRYATYEAGSKDAEIDPDLSLLIERAKPSPQSAATQQQVPPPAPAK